MGENGGRRENEEASVGSISPGSPHSLSPAFLPLIPPSPSRSRRTINTARSAGVMPLMRLAWARSTGRTREQLLPGLGPEVLDRVKVEIGRNATCRQPLLPGDVDLLPGNVAGVLGVVGHLPARPPAGNVGQRRAAARPCPPRSTSGRRSSLASVNRPQRASFPAAADDPRNFRLLRLKPLPARLARPGPARWPSGVSRRSALSCRSSSRYSARLVNIR